MLETKKIAIWALLITICSFAPAQTWLHIDSVYDYVDIGDLDITGTQMTIEAKIYQQQISYGDIVSKHSGSTNANYLLRPYRAEITTTNGFFTTPMNCGVLGQYAELNTCLHIAMVYDGTQLLHYINGEYNGQIGASGNLVTNNLTAKIGIIGGLNNIQVQEQFYGYIDEVRIWNVARTQAEIQTYMFSSIPSPATQPGLLGYYQFNSLTNLTGNATYDGTMFGNGSIAALDTFCSSLQTVCVVLGIEQEDFHEEEITENLPPINIALAEQNISIYLNPEDDVLAKIQLLSMDGKELFQDLLRIDQGESQDIMLGKFPPGVYALFISLNGEMMHKKILIR